MTDQASAFINPYQFIPVDEVLRTNDLDCGLPSVEDFQARRNLGRLRHDIWLETEKTGQNVHSGRFICKLTTKTPLVIGAERRQNDNKQPAEIAPFLFDGKPAIPASSLRGMLSSLCERASGSALRVLHDKKPLSYRMAMKENLSAMGVLREKDGELVLQPLAVGLHTKQENGGYVLENTWRKVFPRWRLKAYFGFYEPKAEEKTKQLDEESESVSNAHKQSSNPDYWYLDIKSDLGSTDKPLNYSRIRKKGSALLGQEPVYAGAATPEAKAGDYRGLVRVLGWRETDMADSKKHEIFLPFPPEAEAFAPEWPTFPISARARERFRQLADEVFDPDMPPEDQRPFGELGRARTASGNKKGPLEPKPWDIVFFDIAKRDDGTIEVSEFAYSSIWRRRVENDKKQAVGVFDFFRKSEADSGRELLPMHAGRQHLTPAEALFGFVGAEDGQGKRNDAMRAGGGKGLAYAGRVRVSMAVAEADDVAAGDTTTLKILGAPKLPAPAMYFHQPSNRFIEKAELSPEKKHRPNGAKMYVHQSAKQKPWQSKHQAAEASNQQSKVKPIKVESSFWFCVDFENINNQELQLLAFTLRPDPQFYHKLGMGKSLGLGTVSITPAALALNDRKARYSDFTPDAPLWNRLIVDGNQSPQQALRGCPFDLHGYPQATESGAESPAALATAWREKLKKALPQTHDSLLAIGKLPDHRNPPVRTPLAIGQSDDENETFKWHVNNQEPKNQKQMLGPMDGKLKSLKTNAPPPKTRR